MTELSEKLKRKLQSDGVQAPVDGIDILSRNSLRQAKKNANRRTGNHILANELSHGKNDLASTMEMMHGKKRDAPAQYSDEAQRIKIEKAAAKRARKAGK